MAEPRGGEREGGRGGEREREKPPSLIVSRWSCKCWADWKNSPSRPDATVAPTVPSRAILHFQSSPEQAVKQPLDLHRSPSVPALSALFSFTFILSTELRRHDCSSATDTQRRTALFRCGVRIITTAVYLHLSGQNFSHKFDGEVVQLEPWRGKGSFIFHMSWLKAKECSMCRWTHTSGSGPETQRVSSADS